MLTMWCTYACGKVWAYVLVGGRLGTCKSLLGWEIASDVPELNYCANIGSLHLPYEQRLLLKTLVSVLKLPVLLPLTALQIWQPLYRLVSSRTVASYLPWNQWEFVFHLCSGRCCCDCVDALPNDLISSMILELLHVSVFSLIVSVITLSKYWYYLNLSLFLHGPVCTLCNLDACPCRHL